MMGWSEIGRFPSLMLVFLIRVYQRCLSPFKPPCCRFVPTCSEYAREALAVHGLWVGMGLTLWRLLRCHPFYHGPLYDPVPPRKEHQ